MFCTQCGTKNPEDAKFCKECGHKVATDFAKEPATQPGQDARTDLQVKALLIAALDKSESGDVEGAITMCAEAMTLGPQKSETHALMSSLLEKKGDLEGAIAEREKAIHFNPLSIADKERLEVLKNAPLEHRTIKMTPPKIISTHKPVTSVADNNRTLAVIGAASLCLVLIVSAIAVLFTSSRNGQDKLESAKTSGGTQIARNDVNAQQFPLQNTGPSAPSSPGYPPVVQQLGPGANPNVSTNPINPQYQQNPQNQMQNNQMRDNRPDTSSMIPMNGGRASAPAVFNPQMGGNLESDPRFNGGTRPTTRTEQGSGQGGNTVYLPDNTSRGPVGGGANNPATSPGVSPGVNGGTSGANVAQGQGSGQNPGRTNNPRAGQGRIEIVVSPESAAGSKSGGVNAGRPDPNSASMESKSRRQGAQEFQLQKNYKRAIQEYSKALDGAGDEVGNIYFQIGLCYQSMSDRESAITAYTDGIKAFNELVAAGRNVDAAKEGIKLCQSGLRACK